MESPVGGCPLVQLKRGDGVTAFYLNNPDTVSVIQITPGYNFCRDSPLNQNHELLVSLSCTE